MTTHNHDTDASTSDSVETDDSVGSMGRRDYLKTVATAAAAVGIGTSATGSGAAETADTSLSVDERIAEHRTGDLEVVVENPDGSTVSDAEVSIAQQEHAFSFGTAVNADRLVNGSDPGDNYREYIPELFNTAVLGNHHKWRFWENNRQVADEATNWLLDQGLDMRGHVCLWGREDVAAIPDDVLTAIEDRDAETIRQRSMAHIEEIITHYGEDITDWDVVNEAMHVYQLQLGVYGDQIDTEEPWNGEVVPWTSELLAEWYDQAASVIEANDLDVGIAVNDFNQFPYAYTDNRYESEIEHINANGAQLDTVGLQAHIAARQGEFNSNDDPDGRIDADQVVSEINTWADHGARVKITEFDTYNGDDWNGDEERADVTENYLKGAFSHPGVDAFIMWGFWDGDHWEDEAPLFYDDWSRKPAYDVWTGLVYDEWWTDDSGTTDGSGVYATTAFLGDHEITVSTDSAETTETVSVSDASGTTTVTVTVEGDGSAADDTQPPSVPMNLSVSTTTDSTVTVSWDGVTDNGTAGLDQYVVSVDGSQDQTIGAGMTTATIEGLSAARSYEIAVSAVDSAGNESEAATVSATTAVSDDDDDDEPSEDTLVVDDYDGDPGWSSNRNDLGQWCGAGSFENGSGEVEDGTLVLEYDNAGWFVEQVGQDVSEYSDLVLVLGGDDVQADEFLLDVGGVRGLLSRFTDDAIGSSASTVTVDMESAGIDPSTGGLSVRLNFWQGGSGTLEIEEIRFQ